MSNSLNSLTQVVELYSKERGIIRFYVRKATKSDDFASIVKLMVTGRLVSEREEKDDPSLTVFIDRYSKYMGMENNEYSYNNFWICIDDNERIVGLLHGYIPSSINEQKALRDYASVDQKLNRKMRYAEYKRSMMPLVEKNKSAYVQTIVVDEIDGAPEAEKLLFSEFFDYCRKSHLCTLVYTDVLIEYERIIEMLKNNKFNPARVLERKTQLGINTCVRMTRSLT